MTNKLFSILIPSWNNLPYLKLCIESILKNSTYTHQIIVHANSGSDGTVDWLNSQPHIFYTHSEKNEGVCYALNQSAALASCAYILYINDDMYVCPGWDKAIYEEIKAVGHNQFFLSSTAIERIPQSKCSIQADFGKDVYSFDEARLLRDFASFSMPDWQGATWPPNVVHKDTWNLVGAYSTEFSPGMYSDPDFSMKLWQSGIRTFKGIGRSRVYHFGSLSVKRVQKNAGYYTFIRKWRMTSSVFSKYYLRRGETYDGPLQNPFISWIIRIKNLMRSLHAVVQKP